MKRRTIIKSSALALGFGITASSLSTFLSGCQVDASDGWQPSTLTKPQANILAEVSERIIPKTDTPGAKDALVHRLIDQYLTDNLDQKSIDKFTVAVGHFDAVAKDKFSKTFVKLSDEDKDAVLNAIADEGGQENIFETVKRMTLGAFFTSQPGATKVLIYDPIPGSWQACIPLSEVGGTWAL